VDENDNIFSGKAFLSKIKNIVDSYKFRHVDIEEVKESFSRIINDEIEIKFDKEVLFETIKIKKLSLERNKKIISFFSNGEKQIFLILALYLKIYAFNKEEDIILFLDDVIVSFDYKFKNFFISFLT
jgi:recombinational DNA repair ATPase RecF